MLLLVVALELVAAFYLPTKRIYQPDLEIGWVPKSNFHYSETHYDSAGNPYPVRLSTDAHGFRAWGAIDTHKPKILFIGDSFTGDPYVSDEDAYFRIAGDLLDAEVFAVGAGGYGTLQELMILKRYAGEIDPDYFVLQFCANDFANNSFALESRSILSSQKNIRPYLDGDKVVYRLSPNHWYRYLYNYSKLFRFLDRSVQQVLFAYYGGYVAPEEIDKGEALKALENAEKITETLLRKMAGALPEHTRLFTFSCSTKNPADTERWIRVARRAGFTPLHNVSLSVETAEQAGDTVRAADGDHWGPGGHRIIGASLAKELEKGHGVSTVAGQTSTD